MNENLFSSVLPISHWIWTIRDFMLLVVKDLILCDWTIEMRSSHMNLADTPFDINLVDIFIGLSQEEEEQEESHEGDQVQNRDQVLASAASIISHAK